MTEKFLQERVYLRGVSPKTAAWYVMALRQFEGAFDSKASLVERIVILKNRGVSHITINSYLRGVNAYLHWRDGKGEKCSPQCEHVRIPKLKEEQKVLATLTPTMVTSLMRFSKTNGTNLRRAHLIALTILDTGLRASEVLGLSVKDIDLDNLIMKVLGKGGKHRLVPFSAELRKVLFRLISKVQQGGEVVAIHYAFGTNHNTKVSVHNLDRDFRVLGKKLGITGLRFSPHTLRHSFAVMYLRNGGNLEFLRRILGHTNLTTTQKYLKSLGVEDLGAVHNQLSPLSARRQ